jgi:quercetin dioxygenase-like cupin family protein
MITKSGMPKGRRTIAVAALIAVVAAAVTARATPSLGFIANQILASGFVPAGISQHLQMNKNPDGSVTPWQIALQVQGDTDAYVHRLVLAPGGYSGWHTHPGLLIGVVKSGQIDFFDADCRKRTVGPGEVYTENADVHGIINNGSADAELYISYLIKRGAPRRLDAPAPECASQTGIP